MQNKVDQRIPEMGLQRGQILVLEETGLVISPFILQFLFSRLFC